MTQFLTENLRYKIYTKDQCRSHRVLLNILSQKIVAVKYKQELTQIYFKW